jgi:tetratricopeptide (TPR) repeat protein
MAIATAAALLLLVAAAALWWSLRPAPAAAHGMTVRLAGFQTLSADLPATMRETVDAEIAAAFNADGIVGVSTASAPEPGDAPAYALGGTIQRDGHTIRVITRLANERSGATLWSDTFNYDGNEVSKVPRHVAVDAGNVVRCGLFGASTYRKPLPDAVLRDYMQFCEGHWDPNMNEGRKALVPAQRVVAAVPDFSWGWAAVAGAYWKVAGSAANPDEARALGRQAADRAIALDPRNSEAMYIKSVLTDRQDWLGRESLFKRAIAARRLDCGCEHHQYGTMLLNVGRTSDAVDQLRQANDMLALYVYTPLTLADALVVSGKPDEARQYFDAAIGLSPDAAFAERMALFAAAETSDEGRLLKLKSPASAELRVALLNGLRAKGTGDAGAKGQAVRGLLAVPENLQDGAVAWLLADLGAKREAFDLAARLADGGDPGPSVFWHPSMRGSLSDPAFPALAKQLGLMTYWKTTRTKPDVCAAKDPPPFCRMI